MALLTAEQLRQQDMKERTAANNVIGDMVGIPARAVMFPGSNKPSTPTKKTPSKQPEETISNAKNPLVQAFHAAKSAAKDVSGGVKNKFNNVKDFLKNVNGPLTYAGGQDNVKGLTLLRPDQLRTQDTSERTAANNVVGDAVGIPAGTVTFPGSEDKSMVAPQSQDINKFYNALASHESRGILGDATGVVNKESGATGEVQITKPMFEEWKRNYSKNKNFAKKVDWEDFSDNPQLQRMVANESIEGILSKPMPRDWPTSTPTLESFKEEVMANYTDPISRLAGEWVAGPNWVAKLDNPTASGSTETVRDYINKVRELYNTQI